MNYVIIFCTVVAIIFVAVYVRHYTGYPKDFKMLQVACADLNPDIIKQRHPIVVDGVSGDALSRALPLKELIPCAGEGKAKAQYVVIQGEYVNLYHPDDQDYLKVELAPDSALMVPRHWRYEAAPGAACSRFDWAVKNMLKFKWP